MCHEIIAAKEEVQDSLRCACHTLQLTVHHAIKDNEEAAQYVDRARKIVNFIRNHSNNTTVYKGKIHNNKK